MGTAAHMDDLRSRVVEEILAGASRRQEAERFKVSAASAFAGLNSTARPVAFSPGRGAARAAHRWNRMRLGCWN